MSPLLERTLPSDRKPKPLETRLSGQPDNRPSGLTEAAQRQEQIEVARGPKRRFEYLIPERVGLALAHKAASQGVSATTMLLQILRDAGYPVIEEDMIDLRKMPKR